MNYTVTRYVTQHSQCSSVQSLAYFAMPFTLMSNKCVTNNYNYYAQVFPHITSLWNLH